MAVRWHTWCAEHHGASPLPNTSPPSSAITGRAHYAAPEDGDPLQAVNVGILLAEAQRSSALSEALIISHGFLLPLFDSRMIDSVSTQS